MGNALEKSVNLFFGKNWFIVSIVLGLAPTYMLLYSENLFVIKLSIETILLVYFAVGLSALFASLGLTKASLGNMKDLHTSSFFMLIATVNLTGGISVLLLYLQGSIN